MASTASFNVCMNQFLESLKGTFPEKQASLDFVQTSVDALIAEDPTMPSKLFLQSVSPYLPQILSKDPKVFESLKAPMGLDLQGMWNDPGLSENTREAIWGYLSTLTMLSTTSGMPKELLTAIEGMASGAADRVKNGEDFSTVASSMIESILGGAGDGTGAGLDLSKLLQNL